MPEESTHEILVRGFSPKEIEAIGRAAARKNPRQSRQAFCKEALLAAAGVKTQPKAPEKPKNGPSAKVAAKYQQFELHKV